MMNIVIFCRGHSAHGRLANPTHPMWEHFNFPREFAFNVFVHVLPGAGAFLAGQSVMGHPFWGVWLSSGLMCAAICWALQGWMPPPWALLGAVLAVIRLATFSYWSDSYWGGSVTAIGGALVLGAFPRIKQDRRVRDAVLMALGMALLASTRPFEGLFFSLPFLVALAWWGLRSESPSATEVRLRGRDFDTYGSACGTDDAAGFRRPGVLFLARNREPILALSIEYAHVWAGLLSLAEGGTVPEFHHPFCMLYRGAVVGCITCPTPIRTQQAAL
jgi:hypothetical protein